MMDWHYRKYVQKGVLETAINSKLSLYNKSNNIDQIKKKFKKWNYKITSISEFHKRNPERNIYFSNEIFENNIKLNFPSEKNLRILSRILRGKKRIIDFFNIFVMKSKIY